MKRKNPNLNNSAASSTENSVSWVFNTILECLCLNVFFLVNSQA